MYHFPRIYFRRTWKIIGICNTPQVGRAISGGLPKSQQRVSASSQSKQHKRKTPSILTHSATSSSLTKYPLKADLLTKKDCEDILRSKLGNTNFQIQDFSLGYFTGMLGFHGRYAGLKINCVVDDKNEEFRFFVKTIDNNPIVQEKYLGFVRQMYKEFVFLTEIHDELQQFVQKLITAHCRLGRSDEFLVLDDCCSMGYSSMASEYLDEHLARTGIAALANFHAASLICREKTGVIVSEKYKKVDYESLFSEPDKPLLCALDAGVRQMAAAFFTDVIPQESQNALFNEMLKKTVEMHRNHPKKYSKVACQGDPRMTNMLFKYAEDGTATDCILVDFGIMRFAPPAMEVMQFLHANSTDEFRKMNACSLKNTYYDNLTTICAQNGVEVSRALPRDEFDESCAYYEDWGICTRVYYEYIVRIPEEELTQVLTSIDMFLDLMVYGNAVLGLAAFPKNESYRKSFTEALKSAARFYGYLVK